MISRRTFLSPSLLGAGTAAAWPLLAGAKTAGREKFHAFTQRHLRVLNRYLGTLENVPPRKVSQS